MGDDARRVLHNVAIPVDDFGCALSAHSCVPPSDSESDRSFTLCE